jgi:Protein of unknown function (DUF2992).
MNIKLTVFFDDPFWVGVFERTDGVKLETSRIVFGKEPKDYEVYSYVLENYFRLRFSAPVELEARLVTKINPKRLQRKIHKEISSAGIGTKAQQAIKLEQEVRKLEQKKVSRERVEELKSLRFEMKQEKKKEKKKGH